MKKKTARLLVWIAIRRYKNLPSRAHFDNLTMALGGNFIQHFKGLVFPELEYQFCSFYFPYQGQLNQSHFVSKASTLNYNFFKKKKFRQDFTMWPRLALNSRQFSLTSRRTQPHPTYKPVLKTEN